MTHSNLVGHFYAATQMEPPFDLYAQVHHRLENYFYTTSWLDCNDAGLKMKTIASRKKLFDFLKVQPIIRQLWEAMTFEVMTLYQVVLFLLLYGLLFS